MEDHHTDDDCLAVFWQLLDYIAITLRFRSCFDNSPADKTLRCVYSRVDSFGLLDGHTRSFAIQLLTWRRRHTGLIQLTTGFMYSVGDVLLENCKRSSCRVQSVPIYSHTGQNVFKNQERDFPAALASKFCLYCIINLEIKKNDIYWSWANKESSQHHWRRLKKNQRTDVVEWLWQIFKNTTNPFCCCPILTFITEMDKQTCQNHLTKLTNHGFIERQKQALKRLSTQLLCLEMAAYLHIHKPSIKSIHLEITRHESAIPEPLHFRPNEACLLQILGLPVRSHLWRIASGFQQLFRPALPVAASCFFDPGRKTTSNTFLNWITSINLQHQYHFPVNSPKWCLFMS